MFSKLKATWSRLVGVGATFDEPVAPAVEYKSYSSTALDTELHGEILPVSRLVVMTVSDATASTSTLHAAV
jgi:hypothetical protein